MQPYWDPFNPPKDDKGSFLDYPKYRADTAFAGYWTDKDFVLIVSVKRFFDM
jgi:hypothetical protein